jgi:hypothetical protein
MTGVVILRVEVNIPDWGRPIAYKDKKSIVNCFIEPAAIQQKLLLCLGQQAQLLGLHPCFE